MMSNNAKEVWKFLIEILGIVLIVGIMFGTMAWVFSPTEFVITFKMDNNTLEAVKSINWSAMPK